MTSETRRRKILGAIEDCDHYIAKEGPRSKDLRPKETQELLDWYSHHREKLVAMLKESAYVRCN